MDIDLDLDQDHDQDQDLDLDQGADLELENISNPKHKDVDSRKKDPVIFIALQHKSWQRQLWNVINNESHLFLQIKNNDK